VIDSRGEPPRRQPSDHPPVPSPPIAGGAEQQRPPRAARTFNRERFLLVLVAVVLIGEVGLYSTGAAICAWRTFANLPAQGGVCSRFDDAVNTAFGAALNTLLALLGGRALSDSRRPPGP
jgi:hypothetical protein